MKWSTKTIRKPRLIENEPRIVYDLVTAEREESARGRRIVAFEPYRKALWKIYTVTAIDQKGHNDTRTA